MTSACSTPLGATAARPSIPSAHAARNPASGREIETTGSARPTADNKETQSCLRESERALIGVVTCFNVELCTCIVTQLLCIVYSINFFSNSAAYFSL